MAGIDQFFTKKNVAFLCWTSLVPIVTELTNKKIQDLFFIEPSVGDGVFYDLVPSRINKIGIDIDSRRKNFVETDFLHWNSNSIVSHKKSDVVIFGNPPFGKRGELAIKFFNKSTEIADTIAFIVPIIFRKFFVQKKLPIEWKWVYSTELPRGSFWTDKMETYEVNTEFQIWTRLSSKYTNMRLYTPPL